MCHKCCLFFSNSVIKLLLDQPVLTVSIATLASNAAAVTLLISDWLFLSEGGASCGWLQMTHHVYSIVFDCEPHSCS